MAWLVATALLGVIGLIRGQVAAGAVVLAAPVVAFAAGALAKRWTESRAVSRRRRLLRTLTVWGPAFAGGGAVLMAAGASGVARGTGTALFGLVAGGVGVYLGFRLLQSRATVARLLRDRPGQADDDRVVLVGRPAGPYGLLQPASVVTVSERGLGFSRASFRRTDWRFAPRPRPEAVNIQITGSGGEFEVAYGDSVIHLTAVDARDLEAARAILEP